MEKTLENIRLSSISRNYVPGFAFYLKELNLLLDLKVQLSLNQRLEVIELLYSLLDARKEIEAFLIEGIANSLCRLLK
jgi:hypothetical protein